MRKLFTLAVIGFSLGFYAELPANAQTAIGTETLSAAEQAYREAWMKASPDQRIRLAEQLGEEGAEKFAQNKGYKSVLARGEKSVSQGFDQVYRTPGGKIAVIEAKGGGSPLGTGYGHRQGTPGWAVEAAKKTYGSKTASVAEKQAARLVLDAAQKKELVVEVVRTKHVLGVPTVAKLESSFPSGPKDAKAAQSFLKSIAQGANKSASSQKTALRSTTNVKKAPAKVATNQSSVMRRVSTKVKGISKPLSKCAKPVLNGTTKALPAVGVVTSVAGGAVEIVDTESKFNRGEIDESERRKLHAKKAAEAAGGAAGAWAGAKGGTATGAAIGTIGGPIGVGVGGFIGGIAGGIGGYLGGSYLGGNAVEKCVD